MAELTEFREIRARLLRRAPIRTDFGVFFVRSYPEYRGTNPRTGRELVVPAKHLVLFFCSKKFAFDTGSDDAPDAADVDVARRIADIGADAVDCSRIYEDIAGAVRRLPVTEVASSDRPTPWVEVEPAQRFALGTLGTFAKYRGSIELHEDHVVRVVFRPSDDLTEAIARHA